MTLLHLGFPNRFFARLALILVVAGGATIIVITMLHDSNTAAQIPSSQSVSNPFHAAALTATSTRITTKASTSDVALPPTSRPTLIIDQALTQSVQHTLDALAAANKAKDAPAMIALFDGPTLFDNLREIGLLKHLTPATLPPAADAFVADDIGLFLKSGIFPFSQLIVVKIQSLPGNDRVRVSTRAKTPTHDLKYIWWLKRTGDSWHIYDFETPIQVVQEHHQLQPPDWNASTHRWLFMVANTPSIKDPPVARWTSYMETLDMMRENAVPGVADRVPKFNSMLVKNEIVFPPQIEGFRAIFRGEAELLLNHPAEALNRLSQAERSQVDFPRLSLLRARAYIALDDPHKALDAAKQHIEVVGDDAETYALIGKAHEALNQLPQAKAAYEAGLTDDPASADCRAGLSRLR